MKKLLVVMQWFFVALALGAAAIFVLGRLHIIPSIRAFVILSGSMEPTIPVGSIILVQERRKYHVGDIVTFFRKTDTVAVTHRIAGLAPFERYFGGEVYSTKGDANTAVDPGAIAQDAIVGKVLLHIPSVGSLMHAVKTPKGFVFFVIIPATIVIYEELQKIKREMLERIRVARVSMKRELGISDHAPIVRISMPLFALGLVPVLATGVFLSRGASAFFSDREESPQNILGAATTFGEHTVPLYRSDTYSCLDGASDLETPVGFAVINKKNDFLTVDVQLEHASPFSTYSLWVNQYPGSCPLSQPTYADTLLTDATGSAQMHRETAYTNGASHIWISLTADGETIRSVSAALEP